MPQATDITVKDATAADVTFTLLTPAAGDGSLAVWQVKRGISPVVYPELTAMSRKTAQNSRRTDSKFIYPVATSPNDGTLPVVTSRAEISISSIIPRTFPEGSRDDFITLATNAFRSALLQSMHRDGTGAN